MISHRCWGHLLSHPVRVIQEQNSFQMHLLLLEVSGRKQLTKGWDKPTFPLQSKGNLGSSPPECFLSTTYLWKAECKRMPRTSASSCYETQQNRPWSPAQESPAKSTEQPTSHPSSKNTEFKRTIRPFGCYHLQRCFVHHRCSCLGSLCYTLMHAYCS